MKGSIEFTKATAATIVAGMDSISVVAFTWKFFFKHISLAIGYQLSLVLFILAITSIFVLSFYATYRNTNKIVTESTKYHVTDTGLAFNIFFSFLLGLMAFISKRFAIMLLLPTNSRLCQLRSLLPIIYASYTFFNSFADMERSTAFLKDPNPVNYPMSDFFSQPISDQLLTLVLLYTAIYTCHYKIMSLSISIAGLTHQYGGWYRLLSYTTRYFYFPIMIVGLNNVFRCKNEMYKVASNQDRMGYLDYLYLIAIMSASYMYAQSSKLLSLTEDQIMPIIMIDKSANYIRQCGRLLPSQAPAPQPKIK